MIVSFSGIDSAGKTTQIENLIAYCKKNNIRCVRLWGKARGTPGVEFIKKLVRKDKKMSQDQKKQYRAEIFQNNKKKKLLLFASLLDLCWYWGIYYRLVSIFNKITILDRYVWDTYVEVKTEFTGIDFESWFLWKLVVALSPKPKNSFLFVIPAEESIKRDIKKHDLAPDSLLLKRQKIELYMKLVHENKWQNVMDGMDSISNLHDKVKKILQI